MDHVPVTRAVSWTASVLQVLCLVGLVALAYLALGRGWAGASVLGAAVFLTYSFGSRAVLARHHKTGVRLTKRGRFADAIPHYRRSYEFFERHAWVDCWRALTMMSSGRFSYREMALVNMALCYSQVGDGV